MVCREEGGRGIDLNFWQAEAGQHPKYQSELGE